MTGVVVGTVFELVSRVRLDAPRISGQTYTVRTQSASEDAQGLACAVIRPALLLVPDAVEEGVFRPRSRFRLVSKVHQDAPYALFQVPLGQSGLQLRRVRPDAP